MSGSAVAPLDIVTEARHRADTRLHTSLTPADIDSLIAASDDPVAGYWEYLDRDNDPDRARPGGRYTLAIIPSGTAGRYDIIYASGARVNAGQWQCGMIKGHLTSTAFVDHYTLEWFDAMCQPVVSELHGRPDQAGNTGTELSADAYDHAVRPPQNGPITRSQVSS